MDIFETIICALIVGFAAIFALYAAYLSLIDIKSRLKRLSGRQRRCPPHLPPISINRQIDIPHPQTYQDKLTSPKWRIRREMILNRDNHQCRWCGSTHNLQVHHKYYNRFPNGEKCEPWDYPDDAFMTLCSSCHEKWHKKYKANLYYRRYNTHYFL